LNQGYSYSEIISPRAGGMSVLEYLTEHYRHSSSEEWEGRLQAGLVMADEQSVKSTDRLLPGQRLTWIRPPWEEPDAPLAWAVLFEDQDLLAVAKPSGLPTLPGGGFLEHTLLNRVQQRFPEANPIHRLGRATSGVVLFARSEGAASHLSNALQQHRMEKVYRALVVGHPAEDVFEVNVPIGPIPHPTLGTVHGASTGGKRARSFVQVVERRATTTLVEVQIETGRPHQIRIHMAAAGFPLWGDPLYASGGGLLGEGLAVPGDPGYLLHALRITLPHPRTGETITIRCQPPPRLR